MATSHAGGPDLLEAARAGNTEKVRALLAAGAPVNFQKEAGK